jgi:hypothetical protein
MHADKLGLNGHVLDFNWTPESIAENDDTLPWILLDYCNKQSVLSTSDYLLKSSLVLHELLIDDCVPEDHAHALTLRLFE